MWFSFSVSEAALFVESQHGNIICSKELFGVVRLYSTALFVPSGFSDRRFETAPDLSFSKHVKNSVGKAVINSKLKPWVWQLTKHSRGIHNARQFWFELALVFTAQWFT
ncbi:hypothetical protein, partial [Vibrio parahaemolyticus]|uniref:hypothetical protein n=1 Tax=Vibrio parahaemolyticus TaxID=670 RepID=UPI00147E184B